MRKRKNLLSVAFLLGTISLLVACTDKKEIEETAFSTSTVESAVNQTSETVEDKKIEEKQMDLSQIQNGDYGSLLGDWEEVAISMNGHDGKGSQWRKPQGGTLTVSQNEITNGAITLIGDVLKESEEQAVTFQKEDYLVANSSGGAVIYSVYFYPKGVALRDFGEDIPERIKTDTDRIIIRSSSNSYVQVFEKKVTDKVNESSAKTTQSTEKKDLVMDIGQIETGDFSSINGIWKNERGAQLTVNDDQIEFSDVTGLDDPAIITGLSLSIIDWNAPDGSPALQVGRGGIDVPRYDQELRTQTTDGYVSLASTLPASVIYISFLPEGVTGDTQDGNSSQEKIISIATQNNPTLVNNEHVYYRID